ncbi:MAG: arsenate reductase (glutaredoxin) [Deltaproteobacteria bacterium]|nr:MAG: arsenate reductase (glutaredoxin) [Deltaproteobacteria bacterium]
MADPLILWHNPRCSKSRQALARLEETGRNLEVRRYLDDPPDRATLARVAGQLPEGPGGLLRAKENEARELGLTAASAPEAILDALAAHPRLIERPVVLDGSRALVARPPELLDEWLAG